jgi:lysylphosphatidylglycerol synthetase-like protein (DUF2156 family)
MHRLAPQLNVGSLVEHFGGSVSYVLNDPTCERFAAPGIEGLIAFRRGFRCFVMIGDPVCDEQDADDLIESFRQFCMAERRSTVVAAASASFATRCVERGYAAIEFGQELTFDPQRDPTSGGRGRELRKKLHRARRAGVAVAEYHPHLDHRSLEHDLRAIARAWLAARHGFQVFITPIDLFPYYRGRRWFYARRGAALLGVLSLQRVGCRGGWVFEHLAALPDAPQGTTELLVTTALTALGSEGCRYATFGPSTLSRLGRMQGVAPYSEAVARAVFNTAGSVFGLDALTRYREKFQATGTEASYLLFYPARIGLGEATGLLRAFNVSLRW